MIVVVADVLIDLEDTRYSLKAIQVYRLWTLIGRLKEASAGRCIVPLRRYVNGIEGGTQSDDSVKWVEAWY